MRVLILNDTHFGAHRGAGATPESRKAMEDWMFMTFTSILEGFDMTRY